MQAQPPTPSPAKEVAPEVEVLLEPPEGASDEEDDAAAGPPSDSGDSDGED